MVGKKQVRTRLVLNQPLFGEDMNLDVTSTFNMTERFYLDRDPDMIVETEDGVRLRIKKVYIAAIKEIRVVTQVVEEVVGEMTIPQTEVENEQAN